MSQRFSGTYTRIEAMPGDIRKFFTTTTTAAAAAAAAAAAVCAAPTAGKAAKPKTKPKGQVRLAILAFLRGAPTAPACRLPAAVGLLLLDDEPRVVLAEVVPIEGVAAPAVCGAVVECVW